MGKKEDEVMASRRVTMQDIANSCGLSRNTVSKIFNGRGAVPEATRKLVMEKAQELGYRQPVDADQTKTEQRPTSIALFTSHMPSDYHFGTSFIPAFAGQLSRAGYTLMLYELTPEDIELNRLPDHFALEQTAGILGIELFSRDYMEMLCNRRLPAIFVDAYAGANSSILNCDLISMENVASTIAMTNRIIDSGAWRLGFVGDLGHCNSFHERWIGFNIAIERAGLVLDRDLSILAPDSPEYSDPAWITEKLRAMPVIPDGLVCANDNIALCVMTALKQMGVAVPERVMISGFDNTPQSSVVEPALTTAQIQGAEIGKLAAELLLDRIENPDRPFRTVYVNSVPLLRASTLR